MTDVQVKSDKTVDVSTNEESHKVVAMAEEEKPLVAGGAVATSEQVELLKQRMQALRGKQEQDLMRRLDEGARRRAEQAAELTNLRAKLEAQQAAEKLAMDEARVSGDLNLHDQLAKENESRADARRQELQLIKKRQEEDLAQQKALHDEMVAKRTSTYLEQKRKAAIRLREIKKDNDSQKPQIADIAQSPITNDLTGLLICEAQLRGAFAIYDRNARGFLDRAEFKRVYQDEFEYFGHKPTPQVVDALFAKYSGSDRKLSFEEFSILMLDRSKM